MPSNKTNIQESLITYIRYGLRHLTRCLQFHFDKPFRRMRFTTHIMRQRTMHELCKRITGMKHVADSSRQALIGFGDWSTQRDSIIRGHGRGPVVAMKRELRRWCRVVDVDEFRTSSRCCKCHGEMENVSYGGIKVNDVLRCSNNECGTVIDRDINGCKNIFTIFDAMLTGRARPEAFCRKKKLPVEKDTVNLSVG